MTKGLSAMEQRKVRLSSIANTLKQAKANEIIIDDEKFIFEIQMRYGLTEGKAMEYLSTARKIVEHGIDS